jgi:phosphopantothenate synthetase
MGREVNVKVEVLYFQGCPNHIPSVDRLRAVIQQEGLCVDVSEVEVTDEAAAKALGFLGSPTIRIDGLDIEPCARVAQPGGIACRRYPGGLPSEELIRSALREAATRR